MMWKVTAITVFWTLFLGPCGALPSDFVVKSPHEGLRYEYAQDSNGDVHYVDTWTTMEDLKEIDRFNPQVTNEYHLFTRSNPTISQPIVLNSASHLATSNFHSGRRTIVLIHGWNNNALSELTTVLVPAFLSAEDVNIIVVDWSEGANSLDHRVVIANTVSSGAAVAGFINWLNNASGATLSQYHLVGHGFGGHQVGIVGRNLGGNVAYITGLNPALVGWVNNIHRFQPNDGIYTEVIHTNYLLGYLEELADVDFYPNGGISMPGCDSNSCDDAMIAHKYNKVDIAIYFAESINSGGFTGRQCLNFASAVLSLCNLLPGRLPMGGLVPKTGTRGVFWLETNATPPFSQG